MHTIKASELPRNAADVLQAVRTGATVTITHYGKPIAQITPYTEATMQLTDLAAEIARDNDTDYDQTLRTVEELAIQNVAADGGPADQAAPVEVDEDAAQAIREAYAAMAALAAETE